MLLPPVIPQRNSLDRGRFDLFGAFQHENMAEAFPSKATKGPAKLRVLLANDVGAEVSLFPSAVAVLAEPFGQVQHDGDGEAMVLAGKLDQRLAGFGLHVRGVDDNQPAQGQALGGDVMQKRKGFVRDRLIVLVVADHATAGVRRQNLGGQEVFAGERTLAGAAGADQDDEGQLGDGDFHWCSHWNTSSAARLQVPSGAGADLPLGSLCEKVGGGKHLSATDDKIACSLHRLAIHRIR